MPEDSGAAPKPELPDYVIQYFKRRQLKPEKLDLLPTTRDYFASHISEAEVQLLDRIGAKIDDDLKNGGGVDPGDAPPELAPEKKQAGPSYRFMIH
jgi:hypothetical protein